MAVSTFVPLSAGEPVQVQLPVHPTGAQGAVVGRIDNLLAENGHLGVRFVSLAPERM